MDPRETADAYRRARRAGDDDLCKQIVGEVTARFATRTTDGTELAALYRANRDTPLAQPNA
ncbi:hypothetical protein OG455_41345 [Kitasatospora sp. NBC_01287]|uniref:hypothetical protein n=1 Tax=Kitasatospora sp. NBC_01287 TaxID=2903573 RepID=UPI002258113D|nr:hypothetical protein [Kitasatospora sp. NBC_01287]MCX4750929.1 hypothetical protein [Kitasatospora sp. NBC_01287]MCX4751820.1 hypothetical protein [Kitasatospora sp. NBC_01287]MCX4751888.1 hypothetical protein [Kitasatospora sp. NBC_01287]